MKTTKEARALVVAYEGEEIFIGLETLIQWGIIPDCFPLPMSLADRVGTFRNMAPCFVRSVKETEHNPEKLVDISGKFHYFFFTLP